MTEKIIYGVISVRNNEEVIVNSYNKMTLMIRNYPRQIIFIADEISNPILFRFSNGDEK